MTLFKKNKQVLKVLLNIDVMKDNAFPVQVVYSV